MQLAAQLSPDVVVIDIELGDEDGIALTRRLVDEAPETRVILISAHDSDELADAISASGAVGFLSKDAFGAAAIAAIAATARRGT